MLETLDTESRAEEFIITEVYKELEAITNTNKFAKTGNFFSGSLNLEGIK